MLSLTANMFSMWLVKIYLPFNSEVNPSTHFGVIALFHQIFKMLIIFVLYFKNYKRYMLSLTASMFSMWLVKIYLPCNFEVNPSTHFGVIALFHQIFKILILFVLYFKNYKRYMLSLTANMFSMWLVKIYLHCNFEVNPSTHFGVISLFSSNVLNFNTFNLYLKNY